MNSRLVVKCIIKKILHKGKFVIIILLWMYFSLYISYIYEFQVHWLVLPPSYGSYFLKEAIQHAFVQTITPTSKQCEEETSSHNITTMHTYFKVIIVILLFLFNYLLLHPFHIYHLQVLYLVLPTKSGSNTGNRRLLEKCNFKP